ncbi:MAG: hypothetical protein IPF59_14245 [Ignavibacteria bacterium]|nr:hypothetical protein [Ignavibacteria bacterium]
MCQAQGGGGTFDTIRISRWTQASVAYHDSVVIYEEQPGIANAPARGFTRSNPSAPWDSVELVSSWHRQLPMKGCVMAGTRSEKTLELHWILRDAKAVRIDTTGRESDKIDYRPIRRIRVHPANPGRSTFDTNTNRSVAHIRQRWSQMTMEKHGQRSTHLH